MNECPDCGRSSVYSAESYVCASGHKFKSVKLHSSAQIPGGHGAGVLFYCPNTQRFLLLKRSVAGDSPGTWCCPGGGVENNETIEQAARRECEEEMQLARDSEYTLHHMHRDFNSENGYCFHNHFATVPCEFTPALNNEHTEYAWVSEFPEGLHPGFQRSVEAFQDRYGAE